MSSRHLPHSSQSVCGLVFRHNQSLLMPTWLEGKKKKKALEVTKYVKGIPETFLNKERLTANSM